MGDVRGGHGAHLDAPLRLFEYVCYGIEMSRGVIIDPSSAFVEKCVQFLRSFLAPRPKRKVERVRHSAEDSCTYCLNSSSLSFFDTFSCVNGIPAHVLDKSLAPRIRQHSTKMHDAESSEDALEHSEEARPDLMKESAFAMRNSESIGVCCFSSDSSLFAICYISGDVTIWDTNTGMMFAETKIEGTPASSVSFLDTSNSVLLICTHEYTCWKWEIDGKDSSLLKIYEKASVSIIEGEIFSQRSDFCANGTKLVISTIVSCDEGPTLDVAMVDMLVDHDEHKPCHLSPVSIEDNYVISRTLVSSDGRSILVGLMDQALEDSYCLLWPDYEKGRTTYKRLDKGTIGSWSSNSQYVVTWIMTNRLNPNVDDENSAFMWNVKNMRENMSNYEYSFEPKKITNPFGDKVFWCQMIQGPNEKNWLIMGISGESTRFLFWDVEIDSHTRIIETRISAKDMILCNKEAWNESCVKQKNIKGLSPIDVKSDGSVFGAVLGLPCKVSMWDAQVGIEMMKVSPKDLQANKFKGGIDLMMSPSSSKFAIVGNHGVMVFCPSAPKENKHRPKNRLETQMVQLENLHIRQDNLSDFKMSFSGDGESLGVLCVGLPKMQVWNLPRGTSCTIKSAYNTKGAKIHNSCLSSNGQYLAVYIGNSIEVMECKDENNAQVIGVINTDSHVVSMGIKDDASEVVLCMEDGSIYWYEPSHEDVHYNDEIAPSASNIYEVAGHNLSLIERFKLWFKRPSADGNEPLIDNNEGDDQLDVEHTSVHIPFGASLPTYTRYVLAEQLEEASFQVSPILEEVTRISRSKGVEAWDMETKVKLEDGLNDNASIKKYSYSYSRISSITEQVHDELISKRLELLRGTSIDLSRRTTLIQSSREEIVVAGNSSSQGFIQRSTCKAYHFEYNEERKEDSHSLYVINLKNAEHRRRLSGKNLDPGRGLAISHDGRHVACLAGDFGSKIVVWNAYASERLLPDYNFLSLTLAHGATNKDVIKRDILPLMDNLGVNFFMFRHPCEMSILDQAIYHFNNYLMKAILQYALKKKTKVSLLLSERSQVGAPEPSYHNVIEASIAGRSPNTLGVILKYLLKRVTHEVEVALILTSSMVDILQVYPAIFIRTIRDPRLLSRGCETEIPECYFEGHKFIPRTCDSLNVRYVETRDFLNNESIKERQAARVPLIASFVDTLPYECACNIGDSGLIRALLINGVHHDVFSSFVINAIVQFKWSAYARIFPYENACNIGVPGLLRDLVVGGAHHSVFGSFVVSAIVEYKWSKYAKRLFIHELCHYCLLALSFSVYCFVLCKEDTYKMSFSIEEGEGGEGDEQSSELTYITLSVSWMLAVPCLLRELRQCVVYTTEHKLRGFVFWIKSGWNWIEVLSYLNLVILIPLGQRYWLHEGKDTTKLSALVAVESLLLWSRMLFYARPFSSTGPLVATMTCIVREIFSFVFLAVCVMFGFALAFRVLYRHVYYTREDEATNCFRNHTLDDPEMELLESMDKAFGSFTRSFFTVFSYTFGDFDLENQYNAPESTTALILFVLYVVIIAIILLNMLIALMGEKFSRIHKNRKTRLIEARAKAIDDIDSMLSFEERKKLGEKIKKYLQVVIPSHQHATLTKGHSLRKTASKANEDMIKTVRTQIHYSLAKEQKMRERPALPSSDRPLTTQKTRFFLDPLHTIPESSDSSTSHLVDGGPSVDFTETDVYSSDNDSSDSMSSGRFGDIDSD